MLDPTGFYVGMQPTDLCSSSHFTPRQLGCVLAIIVGMGALSAGATGFYALSQAAPYPSQVFVNSLVTGAAGLVGGGLCLAGGIKFWNSEEASPSHPIEKADDEPLLEEDLFPNDTQYMESLEVFDDGAGVGNF